MDPDANLREIREILSESRIRYTVNPAHVARLRELIEALDGWLSRGGFLPAAWYPAGQAFRKENLGIDLGKPPEESRRQG
jgi:hypothetical protein